MAIVDRSFKYDQGADVVLKKSGDAGEIIGRADYADASNQYLIRYVAADGRQVENWWNESAIRSL